MLWRLLPALMPSWRFFDSIGPSPRLDYAWVAGEEEARTWHAFRPRAARVPFAQMLARLLWNPRWNETLFITRSAERLLEGDTALPLRELPYRLRLAFHRGELEPATGPLLCYRLRAVSREAGRLVDEVVYVSPPFAPGSIER